MKILFAGLVALLVGGFVSAQDWTPGVSGGIPKNAIAGYEDDGSPNYLIHAVFGDGLCIGKYVPALQAASVPWGGNENQVTAFEYYTGPGTWVSATAKSIPANAIAGGFEMDGSPLFIIRAKINKSLIPGKFSTDTGSAYVPYHGNEIPVKEFEVLVQPAPVATQAAVEPQSESVSASYPELTDAELGKLIAAIGKAKPAIVPDAIVLKSGNTRVFGNFKLADQTMTQLGRKVSAYTITTPTDLGIGVSMRGANYPWSSYALVLVDPAVKTPVRAYSMLPGAPLLLYGLKAKTKYTLLVVQNAAEVYGGYELEFQSDFTLQASVPKADSKNKSPELKIPLELDTAVPFYNATITTDGSFNPVVELLDAQGNVYPIYAEDYSQVLSAKGVKSGKTNVLKFSPPSGDWVLRVHSENTAQGGKFDLSIAMNFGS